VRDVCFPFLCLNCTHVTLRTTDARQSCSLGFIGLRWRHNVTDRKVTCLLIGVDVKHLALSISEVSLGYPFQFLVHVKLSEAAFLHLQSSLRSSSTIYAFDLTEKKTRHLIDSIIRLATATSSLKRRPTGRNLAGRTSTPQPPNQRSTNPRRPPQNSPRNQHVAPTPRHPPPHNNNNPRQPSSQAKHRRHPPLRPNELGRQLLVRHRAAQRLYCVE
jgi:hypothetical protein